MHALPPRTGRAGPVHWTVVGDAAVVSVAGQLDPGRRDQVCARLRDGLRQAGVRVVICRGAWLDQADLGTVDLIARLALFARIEGCDVHIDGASERLRELVALAGLDDRLAGCWGGVRSGVEPRRQPEQREQPRRVEERVEPHDDPA